MCRIRRRKPRTTFTPVIPNSIGDPLAFPDGQIASSKPSTPRHPQLDWGPMMWMHDISCIHKVDRIR